MEIEFYEWEDYGTYLGNDADFSNDTRTVKAVHRGVLAVMDVKAAITGTFSTAKTSLETP